MKRGVFKVGPVSRTLISVDILRETGHDVILTKNKQERSCHEEGRISRHVDLGAHESHENRKLLGFCTAEVRVHSEDLVSPCSDPADKTGCWRRVQRNHEPR